MGSLSPRLNLALYDATDKDLLYYKFRESLTGTIPTSNMMILDSNIGDIQDDVANIKGDISGINTDIIKDVKIDGISLTKIANAVDITKSGLGIDLVDNTADIDKNVLTATKLTTARNINGVSFDGTNDITIMDATKISLAGTDALTGDIIPAVNLANNLGSVTRKFNSIYANNFRGLADNATNALNIDGGTY